MRIYPRTAFITIALALAVTACGKHEAPVPATPTSDVTAASTPQDFVPYAVAAGLTAGGVCALDAVNGTQPAAGQATSSRTGGTVFAGWVGDANGQVPNDAILVLTGTDAAYSTALPAGGDRPDVAAALGKEGLRQAGFNMTAMLANVAAGSYVLSIVQGGSAPVTCPLNVVLSISG